MTNYSETPAGIRQTDAYRNAKAMVELFSDESLLAHVAVAQTGGYRAYGTQALRDELRDRGMDPIL